MDVLTHGLWGGLFCGKKKGLFKYAVIFGLLPDLIVFLPHTIMELVMGNVVMGKPALESFDHWVFVLYNFTHSLVVAAILWTMIRKIWGKEISIAFLAWPLHILMDIPTHSADFFPTKFLYPLSHLHIDGVGWSHPYILATNYTLLVLLYGVHLYKNKRRSYRKTEV
ncbi:hypothetical protein [Alkaliphilus hydrothermalis]|uniref:Metal-dependent hydrolase n=1 Tax=Alkaliphilus hydrothermalis TaxID=1482730 RepID=A0ABS2NTV7_9FIRM|nr:hypothetical protein [Alkaliphilus hydrothermalis]MBM7616366.1 hypothetical protein [Alkaliphilus hydrothermalis]